MSKVLVLDAGHSKDATAGKQTLNGSAGVVCCWLYLLLQGDDVLFI